MDRDEKKPLRNDFSLLWSFPFTHVLKLSFENDINYVFRLCWETSCMLCYFFRSEWKAISAFGAPALLPGGFSPSRINWQSEDWCCGMAEQGEAEGRRVTSTLLIRTRRQNAEWWKWQQLKPRRATMWKRPRWDGGQVWHEAAVVTEKPQRPTQTLTGVSFRAAVFAVQRYVLRGFMTICTWCCFIQHDLEVQCLTEVNDLSCSILSWCSDISNSSSKAAKQQGRRPDLCFCSWPKHWFWWKRNFGPFFFSVLL